MKRVLQNCDKDSRGMVLARPSASRPVTLRSPYEPILARKYIKEPPDLYWFLHIIQY